MKANLSFINDDGLTVLKDNVKSGDTVFFIDPPYTAGGNRPRMRLYTHHRINHRELFRVVSTLTGDFLMTYADHAGMRELIRHHKFDFCEVSMKSAHHRNIIELVIGRDLSWLKTSHNI